MIEAAAGFEAAVERSLAGVTEWRVPEIMGQRQRLGQVLVEAERASERASDLGDFQGVSQPGAKMIAFVKHENLGLVGEPAEGGGVDDAVAVATERIAGWAHRLRMDPSAACPRNRGIVGARDHRLDRHAGPPN